MLRRCLLTLVALALWVTPAAAQEYRVSNVKRLTATSGDDACVLLDVGGMGRATFEVRGTYTGTVSFTVAGPSAAEYATLDVAPPDDAGSFVNSTTSTGVWAGNVGGYRIARACLTAYTSGTAAVRISAAVDGSAGPVETVTVEGQALTDILSVLNQIDADTNTLSALAPDCDSTAPITISTIANNEIIPLAAGEVIKVCGILLVARGAVEVQPIYGTGTACATGEANLSGPVSLTVDGTQPPGFSHSNAGGTFFVPAGNAFCVELSAGIQVDGFVSYVQYTP